VFMPVRGVPVCKVIQKKVVILKCIFYKFIVSGTIFLIQKYDISAAFLLQRQKNL